MNSLFPQTTEQRIADLKSKIKSKEQRSRRSGGLTAIGVKKLQEYKDELATLEG